MASQKAEKLVRTAYLNPVRSGTSRAEALGDLYNSLIKDGMNPSQKMNAVSGEGLVYKDAINELVRKSFLEGNGDIQSFASPLAEEVRDSYLHSNQTIQSTQGHIVSTLDFYDPIVNSRLILQYFACAIEQGSNQIPGRVGCFQQLLKDTGIIATSTWTQEEIVQGLHYVEAPECLARIKAFARMIGLTLNAISKSSVKDVAQACIDELSAPITQTQQQNLAAAKLELDKLARQEAERAQSRSDEFWNQETIETEGRFLTTNKNQGLRLIGLSSVLVAGFFLAKSLKNNK
jgi:hypothetical protein